MALVVIMEAKAQASIEFIMPIAAAFTITILVFVLFAGSPEDVQALAKEPRLFLQKENVVYFALSLFVLYFLEFIFILFVIRHISRSKKTEMHKQSRY